MTALKKGFMPTIERVRFNRSKVEAKMMFSYCVGGVRLIHMDLAGIVID